MHQEGATVKLTDLTEGQYRFKVTVNGTNSYGEGFATVTVLPKLRQNTAPQVVITPQTQTVKLPNSGAVLDGSASKVSRNAARTGIIFFVTRFYIRAVMLIFLWRLRIFSYKLVSYISSITNVGKRTLGSDTQRLWNKSGR